MMRHAAVPVDQRWLGIDRRGIPYAAVALVLVVVLHWVAPAIDEAIEWDNPIVAGDVLDMGGGIRLTPPVGWQLEEGVRASDEPVIPVSPDSASATLSNGSVTVKVTAATWDGTAGELLDQYDEIRERSEEDEDRLFTVTGGRTSFTTSGGVTGVQEPTTSLNGDGRSFAFVVETVDGLSIGIVIAATASDGSLARFESEIDALATSLATTGSPS